MGNLALNRDYLVLKSELYVGRYESNFTAISTALALSLILHFAIMLALPWLEAVKTKPPIEIMAEFRQLPPPPAAQAPSEIKPVETPAQPDIPKVEHKPIPKPILVAKQTIPVPNDYIVPESPPQETLPGETATTTAAAPSASPATTSSITSEAVASNSTSTWDDSELWDDYGSSLQKLIDGYKQYPAIAVRRGWQGLAKILVRFSPEGKAIIVLIEKSTGQKVLDDKALEMVKKGINDLPVPNKFRGREFRVSIPVSFKLE